MTRSSSTHKSPEKNGHSNDVANSGDALRALLAPTI